MDRKSYYQQNIELYAVDNFIDVLESCSASKLSIARMRAVEMKEPLNNDATMAFCLAKINLNSAQDKFKRAEEALFSSIVEEQWPKVLEDVAAAKATLKGDSND